MTKYQKRSCCILFMALPAVFYSQARDSLKAKRFILTTSLLEYIPLTLNAGNINIGAELYLKKRNALYINMGFVKSYGPSADLLTVEALNTQGLRAQAEFKHFFNRHKLFQPAMLLFWPHLFQFHSEPLPDAGYYIALHTSFQQTNTVRGFSGDPYNYTVERNATSLTLNFGYQCIHRHGLTIDYALGFGAQYISSHATRPPDNTYLASTYDIPWNKLFDSGAGFFPKLIYQVRIGWGRRA